MRVFRIRDSRLRELRSRYCRLKDFNCKSSRFRDSTIRVPMVFQRKRFRDSPSRESLFRDPRATDSRPRDYRWGYFRLTHRGARRCAVRCAVRCGARCATRTFTVEAGKSMNFEGSCMKTLVVSCGRGLPRAGDVPGTGTRWTAAKHMFCFTRDQTNELAHHHKGRVFCSYVINIFTRE